MSQSPWTFHGGMAKKPARMSKTTNNWFGAILRDLRPVGVSYGHCTLSAPWAVAIDQAHESRLHVVIRRAALLRVATGEWVRLGEGDVAFLPSGATHVLADHPETKSRPLANFPQEELGERAYRMRVGEGLGETLLTCCAVQFCEPLVHPVLSAMPSLIVVRRDMQRGSSFGVLLDLMRDELLVERIGATTILAKLADVIVTQLIRDWIASGDAMSSSWVIAASDMRLGRVLAAIHGTSEKAWSVNELAREAGMSRSALHSAFSRLLGVSPRQYVARWRMVRAARLLREQKLSVSETANTLGFGSAEAFSRAFRRHYGVSPQSYAMGFKSDGNAGRQEVAIGLSMPEVPLDSANAAIQ